MDLKHPNFVCMYIVHDWFARPRPKRKVEENRSSMGGARTFYWWFRLHVVVTVPEDYSNTWRSVAAFKATISTISNLPQLSQFAPTDPTTNNPPSGCSGDSLFRRHLPQISRVSQRKRTHIPPTSRYISLSTPPVLPDFGRLSAGCNYGIDQNPRTELLVPLLRH